MFSLPRLLTSLSLLISSEATRLLPRILFGCEPGALLAGKGEKAWQVSCECRPGLVLALLSRAAVPQAGHSLAGLRWGAVPQRARGPWGMVPLCVCGSVASWEFKGKARTASRAFQSKFLLTENGVFLVALHLVTSELIPAAPLLQPLGTCVPSQHSCITGTVLWFFFTPVLGVF